MQTITQTFTGAPTTETKQFEIGTFWKTNRYYPQYFALIAPDCIMIVSTCSDGSCPTLQVTRFLHDDLRLDEQIQSDEFSAQYESCQLAIVDAFQTAFPQAVNLEMSER